MEIRPRNGYHRFGKRNPGARYQSPLLPRQRRVLLSLPQRQPGKVGKTKVDSVPISLIGGNTGLYDEPDTGDYHYWVEARDPWGRTSARSTPKPVRFTGNAMGPLVALQQLEENTI